uniref:Uncharacterized protein n=1 Tax=Trichogramma kaykai TaxID=54128 RepID=A0ABD2XME0_9HYME
MWCNVDCHDNVSRSRKAKQSYTRIICTRGVGEALRGSPPSRPARPTAAAWKYITFFPRQIPCVPRSTAALQSPFPRPPSAAQRALQRCLSAYIT